MDLSDLTWRKAKRSLGNGGECVELANTAGTVLVRDSKNPDGPKVPLPRQMFREFIGAVKNL
ncbi:DUF397 domain-containing protein [Actinomadura rubteroloni]|uniref:DUF397 domain-containing protein n=1 Tax=Actinomadura rubteroloni TaxID=1926885 RepID=UPI000CD8B14B|nr:DUF397 domain-containing protein [Actinomadura rubteroloni]